MNRSSVSLPRSLARLVTVLLTALAVLLTSAGLAAAHVTVSSTDATPGGYGKLTFRVPNESDTANTVAVRIQIREEAAMTSLSTAPVPGWTVTTTTSEVSEPLASNDLEDITSYVSLVEFRADADGGIRPGQFQEFAISGGPFPDTDQISYPVVQTYSDGSEAAWIEPSVDGLPEPNSPAPVLTFGPRQETGPVAPTSQADTGSSDDHGHTGAAAFDPAALALFLAILALLVGGTGAFLGWRAHRRTVGS
jgi:periplasmic copper chaperone A